MSNNSTAPIIVALVASLAAFMEVLDTTITNVSLTHIAGTLGATQDESTWVVTSYLVANGIVLPLSGWLSDVLGRKRFFMMCIASFTIASFACGMSNSLGMLIFFRLIQGLAGGGLQPTQQAIIVDAFPPEKRGAAFGITGITMIVAPILGPTLGGFITDNFSWQWIFFMNVPVGIIAVWLVANIVQDPPHALAKGFRSIDYIGLSLVVVGLGALQIMLDKGQQDDWFDSPFIITLALISSSCIIGAVVWMLKQKDPIIDVRLITKKSFGLACMMIFFMGFTLYASSILLPLLLQSHFGYNSTLSGLVLSPGGFAVIFLMPVVGKLINKVQARYLISIGMLLIAIGQWLTTFISPQTDYASFVFMRIMQVIGLPFLFIPISTLAFMDIPREKNNKASALYALARNVGGSIGIALLSSFVLRHEQIHQAYLSEHLARANTIYQNMFNAHIQMLMRHGYTFFMATNTTLQQTYQSLLYQSNLLAYCDGYRALFGLTAILAIVALFMPKNKFSTSHNTPAH